MSRGAVLVVAHDESMVGDRIVSYAGGSIGKLRREGFEIVRAVLGDQPLNSICEAAWREVYGVEQFPVVNGDRDRLRQIAQDCGARYVVTHTYLEGYVAHLYGNPAAGLYFSRDKQPNCLVNILDAIDMKLRFIDLCAPNLQWLGERYAHLYSREYIQMMFPRVESVDPEDPEAMQKLGAEALKLWVIGLATHSYDCHCWTPSEAFRLNLGIDLPPMQTSPDFVYPGAAVKDHWQQQQQEDEGGT